MQKLPAIRYSGRAGNLGLSQEDQFEIFDRDLVENDSLLAILHLGSLPGANCTP